MIKQVLLFSFVLTPLFAEGKFHVAKGSATVTREGSTRTICNSDGALLHWDDFSISHGETLHFTQPNRASLVINQVLGSQKSCIAGILSSNGRVALINSNGIHLTATALVDTAAFIASTANLSLDGETFCFDTLGEGDILHEGVIRCEGDAVMIARHIDHLGISEGAEIYLLSADNVLIKPADKKKIYLQNSYWNGNETTYSTAIRHSGTIRARGFQEENGRVFLISSQGTNTVDGVITAPSGEIRVMGCDVLLQEHADIDASGSSGGTVLIGGSFQGKNPDVQNSLSTRALPGSLVKASGSNEGDGGTVIYWSDGITYMASHTETCGKNGGLIEISGKEGFFYRGSIDRRGFQGTPGLLFFDPEADVTVSGGAVSNIGTTSPFIPTAASANIFDTDLVNALGTGPVTILTAGSFGDPGGNGDLTFQTAINWNSPYSLTCTVGRDAIINNTALLNNTGTGGVEINAQRSVLVSGNITLNGGDIVLNGGLGIFPPSYVGVDLGPNAGDNVTLSTTGTGAIALTGMGNGNTGVTSFDFSSATLTTVDGDITINGTSDNFAIYFLSTQITTQDGNISLNGMGGTRGVVLHGNDLIQSTGTGSITIDSSSITVFGFQLFANGSADTLQTVSGDITINTSSQDSIGWVATVSGAGTHNILSTSGDILINAQGVPAISLTGPVHIATAGTISIITQGDVDLLNGVYIDPTGNNPFIGNVQGDFSMAATTATVQLGTRNTTATAPIRLSVSKDISLTSTSPFYTIIGHGDPAAAVSTLDGNITISSNTLSLTASDPSGLAQIGHVNQIAGGSILDGNIQITTTAGVSLTGGATAFAWIRHGGRPGAATYLPSNVRVIAGTDITLISQARIESPGGSLILVVDNKYPHFPLVGNGSIFLDAPSLLSSLGPLRIYTADQSLNTLDGTLNGASFKAGPFNTNSPTEEWQTYYPNGSYSNTLFKLYYKFPILHPISPLIAENHAANLTALNNLLPNLSMLRAPFRFPSYVAKICEEKYPSAKRRCAPTLSPYGSFIFEDDIWRTQPR